MNVLLITPFYVLKKMAKSICPAESSCQFSNIIVSDHQIKSAWRQLILHLQAPKLPTYSPADAVKLNPYVCTFTEREESEPLVTMEQKGYKWRKTPLPKLKRDRHIWQQVMENKIDELLTDVHVVEAMWLFHCEEITRYPGFYSYNWCELELQS